MNSNGPFTPAIFAAISSAISRRCKVLAIPRRFESPVVYTAKSQHKSQCNVPCENVGEDVIYDTRNVNQTHN